MLKKVQQAKRALFSKFTYDDEKRAMAHLNAAELKLFLAMSTYDKMHSLKILEDILTHEKYPSQQLIRLALLHDIGKNRNLTLVDRALYAQFNISKKQIHDHPKIGYDLMKQIDLKLAAAILDHHNKESSNILVKKFQLYDSRN